MAKPRHDPPRGVVHPPTGPARLDLARYLPSADLGDLVEHYWRVRWDLRDQPAREQQVLPHPSVHIVVERGRAEVVGVMEGTFTRRLEGQGRVFGIKLLPGAFHPFIEGPVSALRGRMIPIAELFGAAGLAYAEAVVAADDDARLVALAEDFLRAREPAPDPMLATVRRIAERIAADPGLRHVDAVAEDADMSKRSLQRLFERYVGLSPKWLILRYRLHEALAQLDQGLPVDWARLALELGYFDQAHFIKHFKAFVGVTPAEYARRARALGQEG